MAMVQKGRYLLGIILSVLLLSFSASAAENYTYNSNGQPITEPEAYKVQTVLDGSELGVGRFSEPSDVFAADDGKIYIADTGNSRIVVLKSDLSVDRVIDHFNGTKGAGEGFKKPEGVFVSGNKLYVADTGNKRIVSMTTEGSFIRIFEKPVIDIRYKNMDYQPIRVCVDQAGRIFVVSRNDNNGVIEMDKEGNFTNYFGTPQTQLTFMDLLWNRVLTQKQLDNSSQNIPIEFSSEDIDSKGFLYTTSATPGSSADRIVRRINPAGYNILRSLGRFPPIGDLSATDAKGNMLNSQLVDICVDSNGIYGVLDQYRGRVFTYDSDGNLLYVFGGLGDSKGELSGVRSLDKTVDGRYIVTDIQLGRVILYAPTDYAKSINRAVLYQQNREYEKAEHEWRSILTQSSNLDIAYVGVGKSLMRLGQNKQAMEYFKKGGDQTLYSKAMGYYRKQLVDGMFPYIVLALAGIILLGFAVSALRRVCRKRHPNGLLHVQSPFFGGVKYSLYIISHPIDGFWCAKAEKKANTQSACMILAMVILTYILSGNLTGFNFNSNYDSQMNIILKILGILVPLLMWCVANWCITTLLDGKGTMRDIFIVTVYAMMPLVLIQLPMILLSNILTLDEAQIYTILNAVSYLWAGLLMFTGITVVHEYSLKKTILTVIIALIGMAAMAFLFILFFALIQQLINFVYIFFKELSLQM